MTFVLNGRAAHLSKEARAYRSSRRFSTLIYNFATNFGTPSHARRHHHGHGSLSGVITGAVMISVNVIDSTVTYKLKNQKKVVDAKAKFSEMFSLGLLLSAFTIASVTAFGSVPVSGPSRFTAAINA